jgi:hypothetical protein
MSRSEDEDSNMYGDQGEDNSVSQVSDEEGEDIGYRRSGKSNRIHDDVDDDDDEEEEEEDEEEARKVN